MVYTSAAFSARFESNSVGVLHHYLVRESRFAIGFDILSNRLSIHRFGNRLDVCLHDAAGYSTDYQTGRITGCMFTRRDRLDVGLHEPNRMNTYNRLNNRLDNRLNDCIRDRNGCIAYTNIQPDVETVVQPVWVQPVVLCKRGLTRCEAVEKRRKNIRTKLRQHKAYNALCSKYHSHTFHEHLELTEVQPNVGSWYLDDVVSELLWVVITI